MENKRDGQLDDRTAGAKDSGVTPSLAMGARDFARESAQALSRIEQGIIDADIEADAYFVSEGVLEVEFEDGGKMIVNRHDVSREIWVAGRSGAYHFFWNDSGWVDTRSGEALMAVVSSLASQMAGRPVRLA